MRVLTKVYTDKPSKSKNRNENSRYISYPDNFLAGDTASAPLGASPLYPRPAGAIPPFRPGGPNVSPDAPTQSSDALPKLGILRNNGHPPESLAESARDYWQIQRDRWRDLLKAAELLPGERIEKCQRWIAPQVNRTPQGDTWISSALPDVELLHNPQENTSSYHNLIQCENPACPICARWRSEQTRRELSVGLAAAKEQGWYPVMVTFTLAHDQKDTLAGNREKLAESIKRTFSGKIWQNLKSEYFLTGGKIQAYETTYGESGWHPHAHVILYTERELIEIELSGLETALRRRYLAILETLGAFASWEHGLDVRAGDSQIADYISKFGREPKKVGWGVDSEIAKSPVKNAKLDAMTPLQLLSAAAGDSEQLRRLEALTGLHAPKSLKSRAEGLYREYYWAWKNRARIRWSKGLKALLQIDERLADLDASASGDVPTYTAVVIEGGLDGWRVVLAADQVVGLRQAVCQAYEAANLAILENFVTLHNLPVVISEEFCALVGQKMPDILAPVGLELPQNRYEICGQAGFEGLDAENQRDHEQLPSLWDRMAATGDELPRLADPPGAHRRRRAAPPGGGWRLVAVKGL